jgi:hypothetical protein
MLKAAVGVLTGHKTYRAHMFKIGLARRQGCRLCRDVKEESIHMSLSGTGMQKIQNLGSYVLDVQGSKKHEGEWPNKSGSLYQAWHSTLTPF